MIVDAQRQGRFARQWVVLSIVTLIMAILPVGFLAYKAYLGGSQNLTVLPQPSQHGALASRAVIFIIDGFVRAVIKRLKHPGARQVRSVA